MNEQFQNDDILFDRLVDGELSTAERRELLALLDKRPEGWRKCALAFLEAQAWKKDFQSLTAKPATRAAAASMIAPKANSQRTTIRAAQWLAVAAGFLIAFTFGAMQRDSAVPLAGTPAKTSAPIVSTQTEVK